MEATNTFRQYPEIQLRQLVVVKCQTSLSYSQMFFLPALASKYITIDDRLSGSSSGASLPFDEQYYLMSFMICLEMAMMILSLVTGLPGLTNCSTNLRLCSQGTCQLTPMVLSISLQVRSVSQRVNFLPIPKYKVGFLSKSINCCSNLSILSLSLWRMQSIKNLFILNFLKRMLIIKLYTFSFFINFPIYSQANFLSPQISVMTETINCTNTQTQSTIDRNYSLGNFLRCLQKDLQIFLRNPAKECYWKTLAHFRKKRKDFEYSYIRISLRYRILMMPTNDLLLFRLFQKELQFQTPFKGFPSCYFSSASFYMITQEFWSYSSTVSLIEFSVCRDLEISPKL